jgi:hypothetical protein
MHAFKAEIQPLRSSWRPCTVRGLRFGLIENYISVEDSNRFMVADLTCPVGKNESGKTAILPALYKLSPDVEERGTFEAVTEYPRRNWSEYKDVQDKTPATVVAAEWTLTDADKATIAGKLGINPIVCDQVTVSKGYTNKREWQYSMDHRAIIEHYLAPANLHSDETAALKRRLLSVSSSRPRRRLQSHRNN